MYSIRDELGHGGHFMEISQLQMSNTAEPSNRESWWHLNMGTVNRQISSRVSCFARISPQHTRAMMVSGGIGIWDQSITFFLVTVCRHDSVLCTSLGAFADKLNSRESLRSTFLSILQPHVRPKINSGFHILTDEVGKIRSASLLNIRNQLGRALNLNMQFLYEVLNLIKFAELGMCIFPVYCPCYRLKSTNAHCL